MTVKKVMVFLLILALGLGGLGFAQVAVAKNQEELTFFPTLETGDPSVLEGLTISTTIACGPHLRWYPQHTFGGDTVTEFDYSREAITQPRSGESYISVSLLDDGDVMHSSQFHSTVAETPAGGSSTRTVSVHGILSSYSPDFYIEYLDEAIECETSFFELTGAFRFPVRAEDVASITITREADGLISGRSVRLENGLGLDLCCDINGNGIWFLPQFRDENGMRPYESPQGHGIYYIPWKSLDRTSYDGNRALVRPDVNRWELCVPLDEGVTVMDLMVAPERSMIHVLTREDGMYILSTYDLDSGDVRSRLELLPDKGAYCFIYQYHGDQLLLRLEDQILLTDAAGEAILLTAPISFDQSFNVSNFNPETGDLYFDGETLFIADLFGRSETVLAITAWSEGAQTYYGEYGCSLHQSDKDWYYSYVTTKNLKIEGKVHHALTGEED